MRMAFLLMSLLAGCASPTPVVVSAPCPEKPRLPQEFRQPLPTLDLIPADLLPSSPSKAGASTSNSGAQKRP